MQKSFLIFIFLFIFPISASQGQEKVEDCSSIEDEVARWKCLIRGNKTGIIPPARTVYKPSLEDAMEVAAEEFNDDFGDEFEEAAEDFSEEAEEEGDGL